MASPYLLVPKYWGQKSVNVERNLQCNYWVSAWEWVCSVMNIHARCGRLFQRTFRFCTWNAFLSSVSCGFFTCGTSFRGGFSKALFCVVHLYVLLFGPPVVGAVHRTMFWVRNMSCAYKVGHWMENSAKQSSHGCKLVVVQFWWMEISVERLLYDETAGQTSVLPRFG